MNGPNDITAGTVGEIIAVTGSHAQVLLNGDGATEGGHPPGVHPYIGTVLTVDTGTTAVLLLIASMRVRQPGQDGAGRRVAEVELVGELARGPDGHLGTFRRGISVYPRLGDTVMAATTGVLEKAYHIGDSSTITIGAIHQDPTVPAVIRVDECLSKHFAILGSTGSGKSCTAAVVLREILRTHPYSHIVLLDPHNEYDSCFDDRANVMELDRLNLPFWFLNFEEAVEVLLGKVDRDAPEVALLRDLIPMAKRQYAENRRRSSLLANAPTREVGRGRYSVDSPTPYRVSDLVALIDEQMGRLETQGNLGFYKRIKARIESISQDPRFGFMFGSLTVNDNLSDVIGQLFRMPVAGKPITVVQLLGLPSEILNVVVSVLSRLAFDTAMWSEGRVSITFVCEEAHLYVPRDPAAGFEPTKRAIARIAKEGRKYGVSLCVVSQRPGDIDPTILSQCSTLMTMRLTNASDQGIVQAAVSDATNELLGFLPTLGTREALIFGEGFSLPSRVVMHDLPPAAIPRSSSASITENWASDLADGDLTDAIVAKLRMIRGEMARAAEAPERLAPPRAAGFERH